MKKTLTLSSALPGAPEPQSVTKTTDLLIDHYLQHLRTSNAPRTKRPYALGTIEGYIRAVRLLADWSESKGIADGLKASPQSLNAFFRNYLEGHTHNGVANIRRNLMAFFRWLQDETGHPNPFKSDRIEDYFPSVEKPQVLHPDFIAEFIEDCRKKPTFNNIRDEALFRMLLSGPRVGQVVAMSPADVPDLSHPYLNLTPSKGDVGHYIWLSGDTIRSLQRYLRVRLEHNMAKNDMGKFLWLSKGRSLPLTYDGVRQALQRRSVRLGYPGFRVHMTRHTFVHRALGAGMPIQDVATHVGHTSTAMIQRVYGADQKNARALESARKYL